MLDSVERGTEIEWLLPAYPFACCSNVHLIVMKGTYFHSAGGWLETPGAAQAPPDPTGPHCFPAARRGWLDTGEGAQGRPLLGLSAWGPLLTFLTLILIAVNHLERELWCDWR